MAFLTTKETARRLRVSTSWVQGLAKLGHLTNRGTGKPKHHLFFDPDQVAAYKTKHPQGRLRGVPKDAPTVLVPSSRDGAAVVRVPVLSRLETKIDMILKAVTAKASSPDDVIRELREIRKILG